MTATKEQLRAAILEPRAPRHKDIEVKAWGTTVRIQGMTGAQRDAWEGENQRVEGNTVVQRRENLRARLLARCLVDPSDGSRLFKDEESGLLGQQPAEILDPLFVEAALLSGVGATVESLKGNS